MLVAVRIAARRAAGVVDAAAGMKGGAVCERMPLLLSRRAAHGLEAAEGSQIEEGV
jgi:hypothetical protein